MAAGLHSNLRALVIGAAECRAEFPRTYWTCLVAGLRSNLRFLVGRSLRLPVCLGAVGLHRFLAGFQSNLRFPLLGHPRLEFSQRLGFMVGHLKE